MQSVVAPTISQPVVSLPALTSEPISKFVVNAETPLKLVIKTPVYQNSTALHAPRTLNQLTVSNSDFSTTYSSFFAYDVQFQSLRVPGVQLKRLASSVGQAAGQRHHKSDSLNDHASAIPGYVPGARRNQSHVKTNRN